MKTVYFVRHGESETNAGLINSGPAALLTKKGRQQAEFIATRCSHLPIEVMISSDMPRAVETSQIINKKIKKPIEFSNLFIERRRPSEQKGKAKNDPLSAEIEEIIKKNFGKPQFRYSDEENFEDLTKRAGEVLDLLSQRSEEKILVITHGFIMRIVLARAVFGEKLSAHECKKFMQAFRTANTGLTILVNDPKEKDPWWVSVWNDHAHLG